MEETGVTKPNLGKKRTCLSCETRFFDLNKNPAVCPKCGETIRMAKPKPKRSAVPEAEAPAVEAPKTEAVAAPDDEPAAAAPSDDGAPAL